MKPAISVIVPFYNIEQYVSYCLDSILAQTFRDFELICINDGSKDGTRELLDAYAEKDSRVKVIHQENQGARAMDPELDRLQLFLLRSFLRKNLPVLGICKGMQLINVCLGGGIIQDLPTAGRHAYIGKDQIHPTYTEKGSLLHTLYGENFPVNSAHHQGIAEPGEGLIVIQHAPDGVAEAIVHTSLPILGIQWHPERMCFAHKRPDTPDGSLLLARFLSLIRS